MEDKHLTAEEQLRLAREQYESADDFTVAVEEEFAILDPETLSLSNRFEELKASAEGMELEEHLVGELIASEVEVRTGRCDTFAEIAVRLPDRRAQLTALAEKLGGSSTRPPTASATSCCATSSGGTTRLASMCTSRSTASIEPCRSPTGSGPICPSSSPTRPARRSSRA